jgi:XrtN system VIT domain protein
MRLFAYNHIMSQLKSTLSDNASQDTTLVSEAEKAYIVTPVSSLVVLESQKDYDRFDIKKSRHTLDDATMKSNGAVPEPGEWALIIVAVLGLGWVLLRHRVHKILPGAW